MNEFAKSNLEDILYILKGLQKEQVTLIELIVHSRMPYMVEQYRRELEKVSQRINNILKNIYPSIQL